jgi:aryl-alcohol dehydrogenase-like predicted oxidoreductase
MSIERIEIAPGFSISRIIKGGWQLSQGHSEGNKDHAIDDMFSFVDQGITTFDCADIYTGVEELIGKFLAERKKRLGSISDVQVLTKFVPDFDILSRITKSHVEKVIDRSLKRLGVEQLDMVQFSWWSYAIPKWMDTAYWLTELQLAGKIRLISGTNFNTQATRAMVESGVSIKTLQVQYSLLDNRPEKELIALCKEKNIHLLCYGTVAGGFLSERWHGVAEPIPPYENRSMVKYKLMIQEFGGWELFQALLRTLSQIANSHQVSLTNVATRYIIERNQVGGVIIGARDSKHIDENLKLFDFQLIPQDYAAIESIISQRKGPAGDVFDIERIKDGPHGSIMRYNLNQIEA